MHLYMKGTTQGISAIHPSGSFELSIYPRVYGCQATNASPLALVITNSVCNCIMVQVTFVQLYVFPQAAPSGIHITALRVQIPYTLETHGTTITCMCHACECNHTAYCAWRGRPFCGSVLTCYFRVCWLKSNDDDKTCGEGARHLATLRKRKQRAEYKTEAKRPKSAESQDQRCVRLLANNYCSFSLEKQKSPPCEFSP